MLFLSAVMIRLLSNMVGMLYVKAEILLQGNENLLNESSEGIAIIDKQNGMVLFGNKVARAFNIREKSEFRMSLFENQGLQFDLDSKLFTPLNTNVLNQEFQSALSLSDYLKNENNFISINEIIQQQLDDSMPNKKRIYKRISNQDIGNDPSNGEASTIRQVNEKFFAIKIRQQRYLGKSAIVIFMSDKTKKMKAKIE